MLLAVCSGKLPMVQYTSLPRLHKRGNDVAQSRVPTQTLKIEQTRKTTTNDHGVACRFVCPLVGCPWVSVGLDNVCVVCIIGLHCKHTVLEGLQVTDFQYVFPAIRGIQARREYYTSMCPLRLIPKLFLFDEEEIVPELRAQRHLNKSRVPEMSRYLSENPDDYVFSAITASIDGVVRFEELASGGEGNRLGLLHIPMAARFVINDGQHRRAAIEMGPCGNAPNSAKRLSLSSFFLIWDCNDVNRCSPTSTATQSALPNLSASFTTTVIKQPSWQRISLPSRQFSGIL